MGVRAQGHENRRHRWLAVIDPGWQITLLYLAFLSAVAALMKGISALLSPGPAGARWRFLLLSPAFSTATWNRVQPASWQAIRPMLLKGLWVLPCLVGSYAILRLWVAPRIDSWVLRAYLSLCPLYLLIEALGLVCQAVALPFGKLMPSFFETPARSKGLFEFWGRRWNVWMSDWLNQVCYRPFARHAWMGVFSAFFVSGLIHELLANLPIYLVYGRNLFGTMMAYFLIQVVGMALERKWLRRRPLGKRLLLWGFVVVPAPLVLNEAALRIFQFFG